jgi:hypothetical protein
VETARAVKAAPFMALVKYPLLPERYDPTFDKYHWIVWLGGGYYHDPLWPDIADGAYKQMTEAQFAQAELPSGRVRCWRKNG